MNLLKTMRERADIHLSKQFNISREKAQRHIMAGDVYLDEVRIDKSSELVENTDILTLRSEEETYVSRGAYKLIKALDAFNIDVQDKICMDIGASTGGFTDVLLRNGAKKVYAIDVGYGQLDWKLRQDSRVCVMERTNARYLKLDDFPDKPSLAVMDVSFISIILLLPVIVDIIGKPGEIITLIKPQFEAGREQVGKHGVVRDEKTHIDVIKNICENCPEGWNVNKLSYSPITGPKGNIEFLAHIIYTDERINENDIINTVKAAHIEL